MRLVHVLVTNYGDAACPPELIAAFAAAPKRRDRRPDRRFTASRAALRIEAQAIRDAEAELKDREF